MGKLPLGAVASGPHLLWRARPSLISRSLIPETAGGTICSKAIIVTYEISLLSDVAAKAGLLFPGMLQLNCRYIVDNVLKI